MKYWKIWIHYTAGLVHPKIILLLLDWGADINSKDDVGDTALQAAIKCKQVEIIELLRERGAEYNDNNGDSDVPLSDLDDE